MSLIRNNTILHYFLSHLNPSYEHGRDNKRNVITSCTIWSFNRNWHACLQVQLKVENGQRQSSLLSDFFRILFLCKAKKR